MKVAIIAFSRITYDRRVLRQCALLADMGVQPLVIAYADIDDAIPYSLAARPVPRPTMLHRVSTLARQLPAHLGLTFARAGFWLEPAHRWAYDELVRNRPELILANDWPALVVAAAYKSRFNVRIHYDTHEFAPLEFDERWYWRFVYKPMVEHLETAAIGSADSISTVGPRLAEALETHYQLSSRPLVVRNIPDRIALDGHVATEWPLRILYHGKVLPDRGLELLLDSMALWRERHILTIRGDGNPGYLASLKSRAEAAGCERFVRFENAVKPDDVMPIAARTADVGVHFTPLGTDQRHFSLPNKFFEYIGAGLAVAVSPGADLRALVEQYGVGVVSSAASPEAAAEVINSLTQAQVGAYKLAAREAANVLCWEREREILRAALQIPASCER